MEKGGLVDGRAGAPKTPLHLAAQNGSIQLARILCQKEANLDLKSQEDQGMDFFCRASVPNQLEEFGNPQLFIINYYVFNHRIIWWTVEASVATMVSSLMCTGKS